MARPDPGPGANRHAPSKGITDIFQTLLSHETKVTGRSNKLVDICLRDKDYTTHNFLQWYVSEQIEEEALAGR